MPVLAVSKAQIKRIESWHKIHKCDSPYEKINGVMKRKDSLWFCISNSNGIGPAVHGRCECGQEIDATEYEKW